MLWSRYPGKVNCVAEFVTSEGEVTTALSESTPWVVSVLLELGVQLLNDFVEFTLNTVQRSVATSLTTVAAAEKNGVGVTNNIRIVPGLTVPAL